ncbi:MAG: hypothetical protein QY331_00530 [Melioribacteraceae bacterium]|nr:MAG: hypothetical protein QY331_00530 [Melioribacteraceae bacterium]
MNRNQQIIFVIIFAILWGVSEIFIGDFISVYSLPVRGIVLTSFSVFFIVLTRGEANFFGSLLFLVFIAAILKAAYFGTILHSALIAVVVQGILAEIIFSSIKDFKKASITTGIVLLLYTFLHGIVAHGFVWGTHIFITYKNMLRGVFLLDPISQLPLEFILIVFGILNLLIGLLVGYFSFYISGKLKKLLNLYF